MVEPRIVPRAEHTLTRRDVDPDALRVLYRLHQLDYRAYLVGGSVRDLLLGRRPKDFDIGTDAHPYQIKRAFRNCWIIGRRFRLAHVKFGTKTIEVATFRKNVPQDATEDASVAPPDGGALEPLADGATSATAPAETLSETDDALVEMTRPERDRLIERDNTFGTPEEDAFRRDFTVNALFYDIATFSIIDYVGGLDDLRARTIRCIGNPDERFQEDPVRMLRAIVLGARLAFDVDPAIYASIKRHRAQIARAAPARLIEEFYKILRSGSSEAAFKDLARTGLLEHLSPELVGDKGKLVPAVAESLRRLDAYRRGFADAPPTLTNPLLLGSLIVPLGRPARARRRAAEEAEGPKKGPVPMLGMMPLARRDVDRLGLLLALQKRLTELEAPPRGQRALMHRPVFADALLWLELHGQAPEAVEHWKRLQSEAPPPATDEGDADFRPRRRRRRRRGPRRRPPTP